MRGPVNGLPSQLKTFLHTVFRTDVSFEKGYILHIIGEDCHLKNLTQPHLLSGEISFGNVIVVWIMWEDLWPLDDPLFHVINRSSDLGGCYSFASDWIW